MSGLAQVIALGRATRVASAAVLFSASVLASAAVLASGCSRKPKRTETKSTSDAPAFEITPPSPERTTDDGDDVTGANKLVYLMSTQGSLYSFNPRESGKSGYHLIGKLDCRAAGTPQSMAVDRHKTAWVFYGSGELFKVSILDASCQSTPYRHPSQNHLLGMGFTAVAPGSSAEQLYIVGPTLGLSTISMPDLQVNVSAKLTTPTELTGGGDGKLFMFNAISRGITEVDRSSFSTTPVHRFAHLGMASAYAFARYAGKFYVFTSPDGFTPSTTTVYDPDTDTEEVRDTSIGFVVVGAGQSTLVPISDQSGGKVRGTFEDKP